MFHPGVSAVYGYHKATAWEAQIEAALERTRIKHGHAASGELDDTLRVFHEQVLLLGIESAFSFYGYLMKISRPFFGQLGEIFPWCSNKILRFLKARRSIILSMK
jgi:hypothetical protein